MRRSHMLFVVLCVGVLVFLTGVLAAAPVDDYTRHKSKLDAELTTEEYLLGQWCVQQKMYDEARAHFRSALGITPNHAKAITALRKLPATVKPGKALQCEVILTNHDHVKAQLLSQRILLRTSAGMLIIPVSDTEVIKFGSAGKPDFVVADNFVGHGQLVPRDFAAKSKLGDFTIRGATTTSIRVFRPCKACDGKGLRECETCKGKGGVSKNIPCTACDGTGREDCPLCTDGTVNCPTCGGTGYRESLFFIGRRRDCRDCTAGKIRCPGRCKRGTLVCRKCRGKKTFRKFVQCRDCEGKKEVPCTKCDKSGVRPLSSAARQALAPEELEVEPREPELEPLGQETTQSDTETDLKLE